MRCNHTIHHKKHHYGWDNGIDPVISLKAGETIEIETIDASGGQLTEKSQDNDLLNLDFERVNPVSGPIFLEGAEQGDIIAIKFLEFSPNSQGWGWTANIPGFGLLADQFPDPKLYTWKYNSNSPINSLYGSYGKVPLKPFCGTVGLALKQKGNHSVVPPRRVGGNLDIRDNCKGTTLYLPVEVRGGLLSLGDTHAAQGDGEVCGTAIESPMKVCCKIDLIKGSHIKYPKLETNGPVTNHFDSKGYQITTGIGDDLMQAAKDAVSGMIDWLSHSTGMASLDAYMLCSVCGDLRISEIVDVPNWTVSFYFPKIVLD